MDIALASVIRVELLWSGKAAAATRADVTWEPEGSGRLLVRRSKTDLEGLGTELFLSSGRGGSEGDPSGAFHQRRLGLRSIGAADPPQASCGREGGRVWETSSRATARGQGWPRTSPDRG